MQVTPHIPTTYSDATILGVSGGLLTESNTPSLKEVCVSYDLVSFFFIKLVSQRICIIYFFLNFNLLISLFQNVDQCSTEFQEWSLPFNPFYVQPVQTEYLDFDDIEVDMEFYNLSLNKDSRPFLGFNSSFKNPYAIGSFEEIFVCLVEFQCLSLFATPLITNQAKVTNLQVKKYYDLPDFSLNHLCTLPDTSDLKQSLSTFFERQISRRHPTGLTSFEVLCVSFLN